MPRRARDVAALLSVAFACSLSASAHAWCRTRVDGTQAKKNGETADADGCYGTGNELFWRSSCISYELFAESKTVSINDASTIIAAAFAKWTQTSCALTADSSASDARISIDVRYLGTSECDHAGNPSDKTKSGYNKVGPNQNVIVFRDDAWPYRKDDEGPDDQSRTLGLTTVTFDSTGEIRDADMEINSYDAPIKTSNIGPEDYDLASIVTHEAGHFLGIAHTPVTTATMYFEYQPGETRKQYLKLDDIQAICDVYTPGGFHYTGPHGSAQPIAAGVCDPTPQGGIQRTCDDSGGGCAVTREPGASTSSTPFWAGTGLAFALVAAGLRRRARINRASHTD